MQKKRWISALLAMMLVFALLPAAAWAAEAQTTAGANLTGAERKIYEAMAEHIAEVAAGRDASTQITISFEDEELGWTAQELGLSKPDDQNVEAPLHKKVGEILEKIYTCLELDYPFEMFWANNYWNWNWWQKHTDSKVWITSLNYSIDVTPAYRGGGMTTTNPDKIAQAGKALEAAKSIVQANEGKTDYEKLTAYRDEICRLTSYNYKDYELSMKDADRFGRDHTYGDPWQLVYVFDGDPNTNVVCEGYSKAFKYLCDLSQFDGDVVCRIATGAMGAGPHMWNVVQMGDGKNYLADVTNCDSEAIGAENKLFLAGAEGSADGRTWTVSKDGLRAVYTYTAEEKDMFTDGWLVLSSSDFVPGEQAEEPDSGFGDVPAGAYFAAPVTWAVEAKIAKGTSPSTFSPGDPCTHAEILTFLWRAAGEPVSPNGASLMLGEGEFYAGAVRWAAGLGMLAEGFDPYAPCSRADAVQYIWCAFQQPYAAAGSFDDVPSDAEYAPAVGWAVSEGVTTGTSDTTFEPGTICDRGQIITFLYRAYQNQPDKISSEIL